MLDSGADQAAGLRRLLAPATPALHVFALHGNCGRWVAQLARALRELGRRPLLVEAGPGSVAAALGVWLRHDLDDVLQGDRRFADVARATPDGVLVMRGERGLESMLARRDPARALLEGVARVAPACDDLLLALPAAELAAVASPAHCEPVVALDHGDHARLASYSVAKDLAQAFGFRALRAVVRGAPGIEEARAEHRRVARVARDFLGAEIAWAGWLPATDAASATPARAAADNLVRAAQPA